jgi:hypothetical protein
MQIFELCACHVCCIHVRHVLNNKCSLKRFPGGAREMKDVLVHDMASISENNTCPYKTP